MSHAFSVDIRHIIESDYPISFWNDIVEEEPRVEIDEFFVPDYDHPVEQRANAYHHQTSTLSGLSDILNTPGPVLDFKPLPPLPHSSGSSYASDDAMEMKISQSKSPDTSDLSDSPSGSSILSGSDIVPDYFEDSFEDPQTDILNMFPPSPLPNDAVLAPETQLPDGSALFWQTLKTNRFLTISFNRQQGQLYYRLDIGKLKQYLEHHNAKTSIINPPSIGDLDSLCRHTLGKDAIAVELIPQDSKGRRYRPRCHAFNSNSDDVGVDQLNVKRWAQLNVNRFKVSIWHDTVCVYTTTVRLSSFE